MKAITHIVCGVALLVSCWLAVSPAAAGVDVLIEGDAKEQSEISITTIPGQPGKLVMAYNDDTTAALGLGIAHRQSAGGAWTTLQLPIPTVPALPGPPSMTWIFDPTITADNAGNVYAGFIGGGASSWPGPPFAWPDSGMYVSVSPAGSYGQAWNTPVQVAYDPAPTANPDPAYRFNDRCQIVADNVSAGSFAGNVYVSWIKDRGFQSGLMSDIYFATSADQGMTYTYPAPQAAGELIINDNPGTDLANIPVPAVAPNGTVWVSWLDYNVVGGGVGKIYVDKSTDAGLNWGTDKLVTTINLPPINVTTKVPPAQDALAKDGTPIAVSPLNSNHLYI
ncbi:hypothetical protein LCGC14_2834500, partial [marine sediment metagenome]